MTESFVDTMNIMQIPLLIVIYVGCFDIVFATDVRWRGSTFRLWISYTSQTRWFDDDFNVKRRILRSTRIVEVASRTLRMVTFQRANPQISSSVTDSESVSKCFLRRRLRNWPPPEIMFLMRFFSLFPPSHVLTTMPKLFAFFIFNFRHAPLPHVCTISLYF